MCLNFVHDFERRYKSMGRIDKNVGAAFCRPHFFVLELSVFLFFAFAFSNQYTLASFLEAARRLDFTGNMF